MASSELQDLIRRVREAKALSDQKCDHDDPDACCDHCRTGAVLSVPTIKAADAALRLSQWLMDRPRAVEAIDALLRLGDARIKERDADRRMVEDPTAENGRAWEALLIARLDSERATDVLADAMVEEDQKAEARR